MPLTVAAWSITRSAPGEVSLLAPTHAAVQEATGNVHEPAQPDVAGDVGPIAAALSNIDEYPERFAGEQVTIEGTVAAAFGPRSFAITDVAAGVGPLLVVGGAPTTIPSELAAPGSNLMVEVTR